MKLVLARWAAAFVAVVVVAAPVAVSGQTGGGAPSVVPADNVAGDTGGQLIGDYFVQNLSLSADAAPFAGTANLCLHVGRLGRVTAPSGGIADASGTIEMSCTVTAGRPVVIVLTSADCSTNEPPPFHAVTPKAQRACVKQNLDTAGIASLTVSVDGGPTVDIHRHKYFELSSQRAVVYAQNPVFGATPGPATFVAGAWMAQILGMHVGEHTVSTVSTFVSGGETTVYPFIVHFTVVPRG